MQQFYLRISKVYTVAEHFVGKAYVKILKDSAYQKLLKTIYVWLNYFKNKKLIAFWNKVYVSAATWV